MAGIGGRALGSCFDDPSATAEVLGMGQQESFEGLGNGTDDEESGHRRYAESGATLEVLSDIPSSDRRTRGRRRSHW